jgi:hypothetical protein
MRDGKPVQKEMTEDQKQALEEQSKGGSKKGPGKEVKKGAKEEEISPEELERIEKEKSEKEDREKKLKEEWDQLDEETKHIRTSEDIFKESCIKMSNIAVIEKIDKL